jgi:hypothetical protein
MQQVNLLPKTSQDKISLLTSPYVLAGLAFGGALLMISALDSYRIAQLTKQHQQLEQQLASSSAQLIELQSRFVPQTVDGTLEQELHRTRQRYQSLSEIVEILADDQSDAARGFSRYLTALADQSLRDVWLTRIHIDTAGNVISLKGSTFVPEQIPALLQRLKNSQAFQGRHFASLLIQQNPEQQKQADFSVGSNLKTDGEDGHAR